MKLRYLLAVAVGLAAPAAGAYAQCAGNVGVTNIHNCAPAVSVQPTDEMFGWQINQNPHTRRVTVGQILGALNSGTQVGSPSTSDNLVMAPNGTTPQLVSISALLAMIGPPTLSQVVTALSYTPLKPANNLSDLADPVSARANLGIQANGTTSTGLMPTWTTPGTVSANIAYNTGTGRFDFVEGGTARNYVRLNGDTMTGELQGKWFHIQDNAGYFDIAPQAADQSRITGLSLSQAAISGSWTFLGTLDNTQNGGFNWNDIALGETDTVNLVNQLQGKTFVSMRLVLDTGATGPRNALTVATTVRSTLGGDLTKSLQLGSGAFYVAGNANVGGASNAPRGSLFGINPNATIGSGGTFYNSVAGGEVDVGIANGGSANYRTGLAMDSVGPGQGTLQDAVFEVSAAGHTLAPWKTFLQITKNFTEFALDQNGTIMQVGGQSVNPDHVQLRPNKVAVGFDLNQMDFGTAVLRTPGFQIKGGGTIWSGPLVIDPTPTGAAIDTRNYQASALTIVSGAAGYFVGDVLFDGLGGEYTVTSVNGSGAITGLTITIPPNIDVTPSNPITLIAGGSGAHTVSINLTWTRGATLSLQPSGGGVNINGVSAVSCSGTPTSSFAVTNGIVTHC